MTTQTNIQTGQALLDAFNARNLDLWLGKLGDGFSASYPGMRDINSKEMAKAYNTPFLQAFSDLHFKVNKVVAEGDTVVYAWTSSGTHDGPLLTPAGAIPPTGRKGFIVGVLIAKIMDGKIVREETYWNQVELMAQLGLM